MLVLQIDYFSKFFSIAPWLDLKNVVPSDAENKASYELKIKKIVRYLKKNN